MLGVGDAKGSRFGSPLCGDRSDEKKWLSVVCSNRDLGIIAKRCKQKNAESEELLCGAMDDFVSRDAKRRTYTDAYNTISLLSPLHARYGF